MLSSQSPKHALVFVLVTFVLTLGFTLSNSILTDLAQLLPGAVAILLCLILPKRVEQFRGLSLGRLGTFRWYIFALIIPATVLLAGFLIADTLKFVAFDNPTITFIRLLFVPLVDFLQATLYFALAEEIGWRGFLWANLSKSYSPRQVSVITAVVWTLWHYFFIIWGGYYEAGTVWLNIILFSLAVLPLGVILGWLRFKSRSLWPVVVFHGIWNAVLATLSYDARPIDSNWTNIAGESGIVSIVVCTGIALFCWRRFAEERTLLAEPKKTATSQ